MIGFNAEVENLSNREMNKSTLKLVEIVKYKATSKTKTVERTVAKLRRGPIGPGTSDISNRNIKCSSDCLNKTLYT